MELQITTPTVVKSASEIAAGATQQNVLEREAIFVDALLDGHVPSWMRNQQEVSIEFSDGDRVKRKLKLYVSTDYVSVGNDSDSLRIPLTPAGAQKLCDAWDCMMPTTKLVKHIWSAATKLAPIPWGPPYDASMHSLDRMKKHDDKINAAMKKSNIVKGTFVAGHKKDVVMTNRLVSRPKQVAIFGWTQLNGADIQPLSLIHESTYVDYAHGIRLVSFKCELDGEEKDMRDVLQDSKLCIGVSHEGPLKVLRQPGT